ncbi:hypothetical protein GCM10022206_52220 [Streptomyces chiangmaiensis]
MATIAGPALIEPPRINTTRMIANSSTTDSEMATTDHTLGPSALPARGRLPLHAPVGTIVPPTSPPYAAREASSATPAAPAAGTARTGESEHGSPARHFRGDRQAFNSDHFSVHTSRPQVFENYRQPSLAGHFARVARGRYAPFSRDECGHNGRMW